MLYLTIFTHMRERLLIEIIPTLTDDLFVRLELVAKVWQRRSQIQ